VPASDLCYRRALFYLLACQTGCYRYWGQGIWTDYGAELARGKFRPVQGHRPLVGGDHRYSAPKRLPHVGQARLAIGRRACRHLHQKIRLGGAKPVDRTWPGTCGALLSDRPPAGSRRPDRSEVKAVRVMDNSISRVCEPDNPHRTAVPGREPPRLLIEGTGQPPPDHAEPDKPDPQRAHQTTDRSRTRQG
jgi:hypothetical protein